MWYAETLFSVKTLAGVLVVLLLLQVVIMMLLDEYGNCALLDCKTTVNNSVRVRRQREHHPRLFYWTAASPQSEELLTPGASAIDAFRLCSRVTPLHLHLTKLMLGLYYHTTTFQKVAESPHCSGTTICNRYIDR
ncbi:uncharacterized protein LOC141701969 isoform X3 [Apium graveolens]|uniref:uncharacterized protein LOC141701956 isoform X3 n=1 Tax=Apium graveolens TaxID=4045 RepID=UPI003D7A9A1A